jgi:hypothetical protein
MSGDVTAQHFGAIGTRPHDVCFVQKADIATNVSFGNNTALKRLFANFKNYRSIGPRLQGTPP